jgi:hypothetical protein
MSAPVQRVLAVTAIGAAAREGRTAGGRLVAFAPYARRAVLCPACGWRVFAHDADLLTGRSAGRLPRHAVLAIGCVATDWPQTSDSYS